MKDLQEDSCDFNYAAPHKIGAILPNGRGCTARQLSGSRMTQREKL
jgi:hypothetical protein